MDPLMRYILFLLALFMLGCEENVPVSEHAIHYKQAKEINEFSLQDQHGNEVTKRDLLNQWTLIFLGYTSCPDICPMTLAKLTEIQSELSKQYNVKVWFVSVDPNRDTQQKRKAYIDYFNPDFKGISAGHEALFPFVRNIGLIYAINTSKEEDYYVDHSASVALINPQGNLSGIFKAKFAVNEVPLIDSAQVIKDFNAIVH
ncbi:SCO family protein [Pseudoalteromonas phenolica]|uniref:SCO family protein n=1 Tax=Pseudoalteromonas phenolica TaxID=161398 RepID=UPI00384CD8CC